MMATSATGDAARRADWQGFVAHSPAEAAAIKRHIESALAPHERAEAVWLLVKLMPWGDDATDYRLDRTLARVERRGRLLR
jgi:hypothetical protein